MISTWMTWLLSSEVNPGGWGGIVFLNLQVNSVKEQVEITLLADNPLRPYPNPIAVSGLRNVMQEFLKLSNGSPKNK